jgi:hypothetical protein
VIKQKNVINNTERTGWTVWGSDPVKGKIFFSSANRPYRLWDTTSLLFNRYPGYFPDLNRPGRDVDPPHLVASLRMSGAAPLSPLHVLVAWAGTAVLFSYTVNGVTCLMNHASQEMACS